MGLMQSSLDLVLVQAHAYVCMYARMYVNIYACMHACIVERDTHAFKQIEELPRRPRL